MQFRLIQRSLFFVLAAFLITVSGCAFHHIPEPGIVEFNGMQEIDNQLRMQIVNVQDNSNEINFGNYGYGKMVGDLKAWTDSAVECAKKALGKKGIIFLNDSPKLLKFSITNVTVETVGVPMVASLARCTISLKVETGDGYTQTFEGANKAINPPAASNKSMASVISSVLDDQTIQDYLKKR